LEKKEIEWLFNEKYVWLRPPKHIYILKAPVIYPELKAKIFGLNPAFERKTIILASDATEETLVHECVPPSTKVLTDKGVKPISRVKIGDKVLDHTKYFHTVTAVKKFWYDGPIYEILTSHISTPIYVTPNHPIFVRERGCFNILSENAKKYYGSTTGFKYGWVLPSQLNSKMELGVPTFKKNHLSDVKILRLYRYLPSAKVKDGYIVKIHSRGPRKNKYIIPSKLPLTSEFLELCGWYVAEGYVDGNSVVFSLGKDERNECRHISKLIEKVFSVPASVEEPSNYRGILVRANSTILSTLFKQWFGSRARRKKLPYWLMKLDGKLQKHFLKSYIAGDGHISYTETRIGNKYPIIQISTISYSLAYQLFILLLGQGLISTLRYYPDGSGFKKNSPQYRITIQAGKIDEFLDIKTNRKTRYKRYAYLSGPTGYLWLKIRKIRKINYQGYVYNLDVKTSQSFTADLRIVHNSLHAMGLGEILTPRLAKKIVKFRERFPPILKRRVEYEERELTSEEVKRFGLHAYPPGKYKIKLLELKR